MGQGPDDNVETTEVDESGDADTTGAGSDDEGSAKGKPTGDIRVKELSDENARRRNENKTLAAQNAEMAAKLKEIEDRDKSELEKVSGTVAELTEKSATLEKKNRELALNNSFLSDNTYDWKNPTIALRLADLTKVEIDEDGTVTGLAEALKALADSEPYLLKGEADEDGEEDPSAKQATGAPAKTKSKGGTDREKLLEKYPALRR